MSQARGCSLVYRNKDHAASVVWTAVLFWQSKSKKLSSVCVSMSSKLCRGQMETTQVLYCLLSLSDPQLSLMVKVIPSPDWFVGVDSINLCQGDQWKEEVTFDLQPFDAGTDSGFTFSSPNFPTSPVERVTKVGFSVNKTHVWVVHELIRLLYNRSAHSRWPSPYS